jgi:hypothetical protein
VLLGCEGDDGVHHVRGGAHLELCGDSLRDICVTELYHVSELFHFDQMSVMQI